MTGNHYHPVFNHLAPHIREQLYYQPDPNKTFYAERDIGGWNNIRMSCEASVCLACRHKRVFTPPSNRHWYLVNNQNKPVSLFQYFDLETFRSVVPIAPKNKSPSTLIEDLEQLDELTDQPHWEIHPNCRIFFQYFERYPEYTELIHSAFRLKKNLLIEATQRLKEYKLEKYIAMHIRKGDFGYRGMRNSDFDIINFRKNDIQDRDLLIISDEYNEELINALKLIARRVVCWSNQTQPSSTDMVIDMLCCVPAERFFGTPLSTLSTGIMQWRNRADMPAKIEYIYPFNIHHLPDFNGQFPGWGRTDYSAV